jgi:arylsulfatase A-like enzyme
MLPTLAAVAGAAVPKDQATDGIDASPALLGTPLPARPKPLFWEYGRNEKAFKFPAPPDRSPNVAMRDGKWKLLLNADGTAAELYDIQADPREATNLASQHPQTAGKMKAAALQWRNGLPQ